MAKKGYIYYEYEQSMHLFYNDIQHTHGLDKKRLTEFELTLEFVDKWLCLCHLDNNKLLFITIPSCWADTFFLISIVQKQWMKLMNIIGFCQYIVDLLKFIYYDHDEIDVLYIIKKEYQKLSYHTICRFSSDSIIHFFKFLKTIKNNNILIKKV